MSQRVLFLVCFAAQSAVADMPACPFAKKGSEKEVELANKIQEAVKKLNGSLPGNQADELAAAATRYLEALKKNPSPDKKTSEEIVESLSSLNDKMDTLFKQYDKIQNGNRKEAVLDAGILVSSVLRRSPEGRVVELGLSLTRALLHKVGGYFVQRDNAKIDEEVKKTKRLADFPALGCLYYDLQAARMKERPDAQAADVFKLAQMTLGPEIDWYMKEQKTRFKGLPAQISDPKYKKEREQLFETHVAPLMKACFAFPGAFYYDAKAADPYIALVPERTASRTTYTDLCGIFRCKMKTALDQVGLPFFKDYVLSRENVPEVCTLEAPECVKTPKEKVFGIAPTPGITNPLAFNQFMGSLYESAPSQGERIRARFIDTGELCDESVPRRQPQHGNHSPRRGVWR